MPTLLLLCWKSTASLNYLCWRKGGESDKKKGIKRGREHIAAARRGKRKMRSLWSQYWFNLGAALKEKIWMDGLIFERATVSTPVSLYFFCGSAEAAAWLKFNWKPCNFNFYHFHNVRQVLTSKGFLCYTFYLGNLLEWAVELWSQSAGSEISTVGTVPVG